MKFLAPFACALLLAACGGGGGSNSPEPAATYVLSGQFQKGPFAQGSHISTHVLDAQLNPTGRVYDIQTTDNLGHFVYALYRIEGRWVELVGNGLYMDELTGQLSPSPIPLSAVVDLNVLSRVTVNILTTLQGPRLKRLVAQGNSYAAADTQSRNEVLRAFGVDPARVAALSTLYAMQITGNTDADAVLLAISAVLSQMATNVASANGTSQPVELANYLSTLAAQIQSTGTVTDAGDVAAMHLAATQVDLAAVRQNVQTYYADRGATVCASKFEQWVDQDGSGILPKNLAVGCP